MEKNNNTNKKREKYLLRIEELGCRVFLLCCKNLRLEERIYSIL